MSSKVGDIYYELNLNTKGFNDKMKQIGTSMTKVGKKMTLGLTLPIVAGAGIAIKRASDLSETVNKVDVAFGDSADRVKEWAKTTIDNIGLAGSSAMESASLFGDMGTSMGLGQQMASSMSMQLTNLAGDLASFKNIGVEQATTALAGVFTGETESLKKLGIVMTQTQLEQYAMTLGSTKSIAEMSQAEKVMLRYKYVMDKTKNAQGDFARTSDGTANQIRITQERFKELSEQIGAKLLPLANRALSFFQGLIEKFSTLDDRTKNIIMVVAGLLAVIGPLLIVVGSLVTAIGAIGVAGLAIIAGVGVVIGVLYLLQQRFNFVTNAINWLKMAIPILIQKLKDIWTWFSINILPTLKMVAEFILGQLAMAFESMRQAVMTVIETLAPYKDQLIFIAKLIGGVAVVAIGLFIAGMVAIVAVSAVVIRTLASIIAWVAKVIKWFVELHQSIFNFFWELPSKIVSWFADAGNWLKDAGARIIGGLVQGLKDKISDVKDTLTGVTDLLPSWKGPPSKDKILLEQSGEMVMGGFIRGLENMYGKTQESLGGLTDSLAGSAGGSVQTSINGNINIGNNADADNFFARLTRNQELSSKGLATRAGSMG